MSYNNKLNVPAGGKVVVTVASSNNGTSIEFGGAKEYFAGKSTEVQAMERVALKLGESYEFINNDVVAHNILNTSSISNSRLIDYVIYNKDGTEKEIGLMSYNRKLNVPAGGKVVVTVASLSGKEISVDFGGANKYFTGSITTEEALFKVSLNLNEEYEFTNSDTVAHDILN
ncbi:hypothetical protein GNF82_16445, partial [Clostridium perfringens]